MQHVRFRAVILPLLVSISSIAIASTANIQSVNDYFTTHSTANNITLQFDVPSLQWEETEQGSMVPLLDGAGDAGLVGAPMIPVYNRNVPVPAGMDLVLEGLTADWETVGQYAVATVPDEEGNRTRNSELYTQVADESWNPVEVGATGRWRDIRFAPVAIRPFRMDPVSGSVEVATRMELSFGLVPSAEADGYDPPGVSEALLPLYESIVPGALDDLDPESVKRGTYLMITPTEYLTAIEPLVKWRTRQGFHVDVVETGDIGMTSSQYSTFLNNYYETADPPLDYVVLIGDIDNPSNIPTYYVSPGVPSPIDPNIATDQKYTYDLSLGNSYANVLPRYLIGRISVDGAVQASTVVNKIIFYESQPLVGNETRWTRAVTIADATFAISTQQTQDWVKEKMLDNGFTNVQQLVRNQFNDPSAANVLSAIQNNVSWVAYRGFGSHTSWSGPYVFNDQVQSLLQNTYNLPVITSMVCGGGAFDESAGDDPCFGELWIRLGSPTNPKGAVAFVAPSEIDTHTRWNNMMLAGWYTALFDQGLRTMGQCLISAKMQLYNNYPTLWNPNGSNESSVWFYFHTYNILGDPALQLRAETPRPLDVSYPTEITSHSTHVPVTVQDNAGLPVANAYVVVTENEETILGVARTNAAGQAHVLLTEQPGQGTVELTVSRPEYIPLMVELTQVGNQGVMVTGINELEQVSDEQTNGDGELNPGELILPEVSMQVVEPGGLQNVQVSVSLPEGGGTVDVATETFGDLAEGASISLNAARIRLANSLENGARVPVLLNVQSATRSMTHLATLRAIQAPQLEVAGYSFSGSWGPGDTAALTINLDNLNASLGAGAVTATLEIDDERIEITDANGGWSSVPADAAEVGCDDTFSLSVESEAYPGREVPATLVLTTEDGAVQTRSLTLVVQGADPTTPTGPVGPGYYMYEDVDAGYDHLPSYDWQSIVNLPGAVNFGIDDLGNNGDETVHRSLPFSFPYWDDYYDEISVCSNGWLAFGETDLFFFRNRPIPGPLTPNGGLCAFWDDLVLNWSNSGVYGLYDEENGWYTVEWHNVRPYSSFSGQMSFQIRLFDPDVHEAPGGLGMFAFIYDNVINTDGNENYSTIGIVSPDGTEAMQVEFANTPAPTASGVASGRQMLFAARTSDPLDPPDIHVLTPHIQINAQVDGQTAAQLRIENRGGRSVRIHILDEGIDPSWGMGGELDDHGGPDAGRYRWYDSDEFYGPSYIWIDNTQSANEITLSGGGTDATAAISQEIDLPFDFPYYNSLYTSLWVCEAGYVTFTNPGTDGSPTNTELPRTFAPRSAIFPFWDNITTGVNGHIYVSSDENQMVITWSDMLHLSGDGENGPYTFQVLLNSDGAIHVQYNSMDPRLDSATIGIQNQLGNVGLLVASNSAVEDYIGNEKAIRFTPGMPWLTIAPSETGVAGNSIRTIALTAEADNMTPGLYKGRLLIRSALTEDAFVVPLDFYVSEQPVGKAPNIRISPFTGEEIAEDGSFTSFDLNPLVEDWDNNIDQLSWDIFSEPELGLTMDEDHVVSLNPLPGWSGESHVTFRVSDPHYNYDEVQAVFKIGDGNNMPRFTDVSPANVGRILPGSEMDFTVAGMDPDGDDLSYTWYHGQTEIGTGTTASVTFDWLGADTVRVVATDENGGSTSLFWSALVSASDAGEEVRNLPTDFAVEALYPNPFNASVRMRYALPRSADVEVRVFNLLGREVAHRTLGSMPAGRHELSFDASQWASGLYFVKWQAGNATEVRKAVLMK